MDQGEQTGTPVLCVGLQEGVRGYGPSPFRLHRDHEGSHTPGHLRQAGAEDAIDSDDGRIARLQNVGQGGLHPCRSGG